MGDTNADPCAPLGQRIRDGDKAAEEELVRLFSPRIFAVLLARTRDRQASEDLRQETLLAVLQELRRGSLRDFDKLVPFVYATARNLANNFIRTRSRRPREEMLTDDVRSVPPVDHLEETEREQAVRTALDSLDPTDRRILMMTLVEGHKPGRIATDLGLNSELVRQRKSRALKRVTEVVQRLRAGFGMVPKKPPVTNASPEATSRQGNPL